MLQQLRKARRHESGFTLIELLIVIVILGILAAVVVFAVNGIQDRGQQSACKADLATVTIAAEAFDAQEGRYAGSMDELVKYGLLRSVPKSDTYRIDYDPTSDRKSVSITSTYCATNASAGSTIGPGSDPDSKYCLTLKDALSRYSDLDLDTLDDEGFWGLITTFKRLAERATDEGIQRDWVTYVESFEKIYDTLSSFGLKWTDLKTINDGEVPEGLTQEDVNKLNELLSQPMSSQEFQDADKELASYAAKVCGLDMNGSSGDIGPGSNPDSKYCNTLRDALHRYGELDLSTLDGERFEGLISTFRNLAELGSDEGMSDNWNTFSKAFQSINRTLEKYGLTWADLGPINEGQIPKGMEQDQFDRLRERLNKPMNSQEFQSAGQQLSQHAAEVCGLDMNN